LFPFFKIPDICGLAVAFGPTLNGLLDETNVDLDEYLAPIPPNLTDSLHLENTISITQKDNLIDFQQENGTGIVFWILQAVEAFDDFLSKTVNTTNAQDEVVEDVNINVLLRQYLLDTDNKYVLNASLLDFEPISYSDSSTSASIEILYVSVIGLDTVKNFRGLETIGQQTLQKKMSWEYLEVEVLVRTSLMISDPSISSQELSTSPDISFTMRIENVTGSLSFLLALDEEVLRALPVSTFLRTEDLLRCLMKTIYRFELARVSFKQ